MATSRPDDDLPTPDDVFFDLGLDAPEVVPYDGRTPMQKWAGEPVDGGSGMGGSGDSARDQKYDPHTKPGPYTEVGAAGLAQYGGFVRDEFLAQLQGDNWLKTVREMLDNDPIIGAMLFALQMIVRKVEWRVEPPEGASVEDIVAERIAEREKQQQEKAQAQQQATMQAQAGLAAKQGAGAHAGQPAAPPGGQPPRAGLATPNGGQPKQIHAPIPGSQNPEVEKAVQRKTLLARARHLFTKSAGDTVPGDTAGATAPTAPIDPASPTNNATPAQQTDPNDPNASAAMGLAAPEPMTPEERKGLELAVFVETCLHDLDVSWADLLSQIVTFIFYGFAVHEIVYKKRSGPNPDDPAQGSRFSDNKIGWAKLAGRAQETRFRWEFDSKTGDAIGMWQMAPPKFQLRYIPLAKSLLFRTTAYKGNPEGHSVLRPAYRPWFFLKRIQEYEAIGVERDLAGLPIFGVPYQMMSSTATNEEKAALNEIKQMVRNLRRNEQEGVVYPMLFDGETKQQLFKLELLSSPSRRQFDTNQIISRYEQRIAMTALADFILLGHDGVGARSLGDSKKDMFTTALESFLNIIADVFNAYAIPRLLQMNGEDPAMSPRLTFTKLEDVSLAELSQFIQAMAGAGADLFPDAALEDQLRARAGLGPKEASQDL